MGYGRITTISAWVARGGLLFAIGAGCDRVAPAPFDGCPTIAGEDVDSEEWIDTRGPSASADLVLPPERVLRLVRRVHDDRTAVAAMVDVGGARVRLAPRGAPQVRWSPETDCGACVTVSILFDVEVAGDDTRPIVGEARVDLSVPLRVGRRGDAVALVAAFDAASVLDVDLRTSAAPPNRLTRLARAIEAHALTRWRRSYGSTTILCVAPPNLRIAVQRPSPAGDSVDEGGEDVMGDDALAEEWIELAAAEASLSIRMLMPASA